jgi:hypothetical protein
MMKLVVYGYSYGVKGSRKLEREFHHNLMECIDGNEAVVFPTGQPVFGSS